MLTLEQAQRMDGIALEQKYRALIAAKGYEDAKNTMAMEMIKDQASKFSSNMTAGTASGLDRQGLSDAAIGDFTKTISGVDSGLSTLISSGAVKGTDMRLANYLSAKDDILQTAGAKDKKGNLVNTPEMIAQKLSDAMTKSFGGEIKQYNEAVTKKTSETNAQIAAFQAIVNAQNVIDSGKDRGSATSAQVKALETAAEFAKKQYPELFKEFEKSKGQGNVKNWQRGNNAEFINGLKQTIPKPLDGKGTAAATAEGNKLVVNAANVQTVKQGEIIVQQKTMLTNAEYEFKLQQEMVALLGLSSQILNRIMENTKGEKGSITLYGRSLTQSLLNEARRNYAISRTE
jgi:hypothetical protein